LWLSGHLTTIDEVVAAHSALVSGNHHDHAHEDHNRDISNLEHKYTNVEKGNKEIAHDYHFPDRDKFLNDGTHKWSDDIGASEKIHSQCRWVWDARDLTEDGCTVDVDCVDPTALIDDGWHHEEEGAWSVFGFSEDHFITWLFGFHTLELGAACFNLLPLMKHFCIRLK